MFNRTTLTYEPFWLYLDVWPQAKLEHALDVRQVLSVHLDVLGEGSARLPLIGSQYYTQGLATIAYI